MRARRLDHFDTDSAGARPGIFFYLNGHADGARQLLIKIVLRTLRASPHNAACLTFIFRLGGGYLAIDFVLRALAALVKSGHMTLKEVERYTKSANQKRLAVSAMARIANK